MMLFSYVNTKLRDDYSSLDALCDDLDVDKQQLEQKMADAGFEYNPSQKQVLVILQKLRKYFPITLACVALIWYLCLFRPPHVRTLDDIPYIDKIVHLSMYLGTCSVFWFEYKCNGYKWHKCRLALIGVVAPILMSGVIELAQAYLTTYRTGDWADFATNSMGVLLALIVKYFIDQANGKICRG